jgi:hypothetical protein
MRYRLRLAQVAVLVGVSPLVPSCGGSTGTGPPEPEAPVPASVAVSPTHATLDAVGATVRFTAIVRDRLNRDMPDAPVSWSTPDPGVASIDASGLATALGDGTATVVATASPSALGWAELAVALTPVAITTSSLPPGVVGLDYEAILEGEGASPPTWSIGAGSLPPGLELDAETGGITGVPETAGTWAFTVRLSGPTRAVTVDLGIVVARGDLGVGLGDDQFALVESGTFRMGSDGGDADEQPLHTVEISRAFLLQKTEVTQHQWKAVMGTNPSVFLGCGETCPVEAVSWNDVQAFIAALDAADPGKGYRLPTEAEWEYAARAGTESDYGGTGVLDDMGWYVGNGGSVPHTVALKEANAWGLFDMHGNVMEWVQDRYAADYYAASPTTDPTGPLSGDRRIFRGGSADRNAATARSADRFPAVPTLSGYSLSGFRLARDP